MSKDDALPINRSIADEIVRQLRELADKIENHDLYIYHFALSSTVDTQKLEIEVG